MNFVDLIVFHASTLPEKAAIVLRDRGVTYAQLAQAIAAAEARIGAEELKPGMLVGVMVESWIRHLTLLFALYRAGIPSVSLRQGLDIGRSGLQMAAVLRDENVTSTAANRDLVVDESWFRRPTPSTPTATGSGFADRDAVCRVVLSSGTTGYPKAIGFTAKQMEGRLFGYFIECNGVAWDRMLCLPGLSTTFGLFHALAALTQGKSLLTAPTARETLDLIPRYSVDLMVASAQQLRDLITAQAAAPVALGSLRAVQASGSLMSQAFLQTVRTRICRHVVCHYGSTEAGGVAYASAEMLQGTEGAVGFVTPWAEIEAVDDNDVVLPRGQAGLVRIRTDDQGCAYAAQSSEPRADFRDGWFYPGDRGMVTERGMLVILGRVNELINAGGAKVAPEVIDELLLARPDIKDAAALAMTGASGIEELWVAIVPNGAPAPSAAEIVAYCAQKSGDYRPAQVRFVDEIPRSALGKVARDALRRQLAGR